MKTKLTDLVRETAPLIHCITNYVTANDVANMILATGASPIMADEPREAEDITGLAAALVLNIGTMNDAKLPAVFAAGERAAALGHPIIFDPVGCGASSYRTAVARQIISRIPCTVIRGNVSEIRALFAGGDELGSASELSAVRELGSASAPEDLRELGSASAPEDLRELGSASALENLRELGSASTPDMSEMMGRSEVSDKSTTQGVDASISDKVTEENVLAFAKEAQSYAMKSGAVIVMTGVIDIVAGPDKNLDPSRYLIRNGVSYLARITGSGCMLDGVIAAYCAAANASSAQKAESIPMAPSAAGISYARAAALAVAALGCCGEIAYRKVRKHDAGTGSMRMYLLDAMSRMDSDTLKKGMKIEARL